MSKQILMPINEYEQEIAYNLNCGKRMGLDAAMMWFNPNFTIKEADQYIFSKDDYLSRERPGNPILSVRANAIYYKELYALVEAKMPELLTEINVIIKNKYPNG